MAKLYNKNKAYYKFIVYKNHVKEMTEEIVESVCFRGVTFKIGDSVIQKSLYILGTPIKGVISGFGKKHGKITVTFYRQFEREFLLLYFEKC